MFKNKLKYLPLALCLFFKPLTSFAEDDLILRDSERCKQYYSYFENKYDIPNHLLRSVSVKESGIYHEATKKAQPWPWSINYKGKGYYFKTKQDAINAVRKIYAIGDKSVDVGCMQINLLHHKQAFKSLEHAFDPKSNIEYGAKFLKSNFERHNSWKRAVAAYHSENSTKGVPYSNSVMKIWQKHANELNLAENAISVRDSDGNYNGGKLKKIIVKKNYTEEDLGRLNNRLNPNRKKSKMFIKVSSNNEKMQSQRNEVAKISSDALKHFKVQADGNYTLQ